MFLIITLYACGRSHLIISKWLCITCILIHIISIGSSCPWPYSTCIQCLSPGQAFWVRVLVVAKCTQKIYAIKFCKRRLWSHLKNNVNRRHPRPCMNVSRLIFSLYFKLYLFLNKRLRLSEVSLINNSKIIW